MGHAENKPIAPGYDGTTPILSLLLFIKYTSHVQADVVAIPLLIKYAPADGGWQHLPVTSSRVITALTFRRLMNVPRLRLTAAGRYTRPHSPVQCYGGCAYALHEYLRCSVCAPPLNSDVLFSQVDALTQLYANISKTVKFDC